MKKFIAIGSAFIAAVFLITACTKVADLPYYGTGKPIILSVNKTSVVPTAADADKGVVYLSWTDPKYATDTTKYKYVIEIDSAGRNFSKKVTKTVLGKSGDSLTGKELNDIVLNYGFTLGTPYKLDIRVVSSYANNNEQYTSNTVNLMVTPYSDPSTLTSTKTTVTGTLNTASQNALTFNWTPSFKGYSGVITYSIQYDSAGKNFASPHEIAVGPSLLTKDLTQGEINTTALDEGVAGGTTGKIEYRVKATTAQGAVAYSNAVGVTVNTYVPLLRFYMPGSYQVATGNGSNNWDPGSAPEFIRDLRSNVLNQLYYMYVYLPAGAEFKITQGRDWAVNYGGSGGNLSAGGANLTVGTAGVYRISIDAKNLKYDIREGRMGFVGGAVTNVGWNPPAVFPTAQMGFARTNLFVGIYEFGTGGWKMIDNNEWNGGANANTILETRSYGSNSGPGSTMEVNGPNFPDITTPGRYRVIWDGRNPDNIKYEMSPATEMRVVGDGIQGVNAWDPGASPAMTYLGAGKWQITLSLIANKDIKFLSGNGWGAFDYEDNSNGSQATGTPRAIKWEGGNNFKTPAASGTYTITLDEYNQTVTIQ